METILFSKSKRVRTDSREFDGMIEHESHYPVMYKEVLELLAVKQGSRIVDATVGTGGHAMHILSQIGTEGFLLGIDRDRESLALAAQNLKQFQGVFTLVQGNFNTIDQLLIAEGITVIDGVLFDLGISSYQLEDSNRGFSFMNEALLDMRMNREGSISAYDLVNNLSVKELSDIIRRYGEERWHDRIARSIGEARKRKAILTTTELADIVLRSIPKRRSPVRMHRQIHPATRTFQALRIAVNREMEALQEVLYKVLDFVKPGGRICVISFHSLEDRIVKRAFRDFAAHGKCRIITRKPLRPSVEEVQMNRRSRSAKLRTCEVLQ